MPIHWLRGLSHGPDGENDLLPGSHVSKQYTGITSANANKVGIST
ncbi:hypothetical protein [Spirosoma spitsbergense]|nr:hypothetical protein [Spirosoma spitsbergense]